MGSPNSCSCSSRGEFFKTKIKSRHLLLHKSLRSLHFSYYGCKISHNLAPAASSLHVISASTHGPSFRYQTHPAFLQSGILYTNSSLYGTHFSENTYKYINIGAYFSFSNLALVSVHQLSSKIFSCVFITHY